MSDFLKRNFVLILGVSLPVMLIVVLLLVHGISRLTATRPAYPVLYVAFETYFGQHFYEFDIDGDGRLDIGYTLADDHGTGTHPKPGDATVALYDARSESLDTFRLEAPDNPTPGEREDLDVPDALSALTFSDSNAAPDGYRLELSGYRGGGLLREIFGSGGRSRHHRLIKDGASFRVPEVGSADYGSQTTFVAWVIDGRE